MPVLHQPCTFKQLCQRTHDADYRVDRSRRNALRQTGGIAHTPHATLDARCVVRWIPLRGEETGMSVRTAILLAWTWKRLTCTRLTACRE